MLSPDELDNLKRVDNRLSVTCEARVILHPGKVAKKTVVRNKITWNVDGVVVAGGVVYLSEFLKQLKVEGKTKRYDEVMAAAAPHVQWRILGKPKGEATEKRTLEVMEEWVTRELRNGHGPVLPLKKSEDEKPEENPEQRKMAVTQVVGDMLKSNYDQKVIDEVKAVLEGVKRQKLDTGEAKSSKAGKLSTTGEGAGTNPEGTKASGGYKPTKRRGHTDQGSSSGWDAGSWYGSSWGDSRYNSIYGSESGWYGGWGYADQYNNWYNGGGSWTTYCKGKSTGGGGPLAEEAEPVRATRGRGANIGEKVRVGGPTVEAVQSGAEFPENHYVGDIQVEADADKMGANKVETAEEEAEEEVGEEDMVMVQPESPLEEEGMPNDAGTPEEVGETAERMQVMEDKITSLTTSPVNKQLGGGGPPEMGSHQGCRGVGARMMAIFENVGASGVNDDQGEEFTVRREGCPQEGGTPGKLAEEEARNCSRVMETQVADGGAYNRLPVTENKGVGLREEGLVGFMPDEGADSQVEPLKAETSRENVEDALVLMHGTTYPGAETVGTQVVDVTQFPMKSSQGNNEGELQEGAALNNTVGNTLGRLPAGETSVIEEPVVEQQHDPRLGQQESKGEEGQPVSRSENLGPVVGGQTPKMFGEMKGNEVADDHGDTGGESDVVVGEIGKVDAPVRSVWSGTPDNGGPATEIQEKREEKETQGERKPAGGSANEETAEKRGLEEGGPM